jgi:hypothetical protein
MIQRERFQIVVTDLKVAGVIGQIELRRAAPAAGHHLADVAARMTVATAVFRGAIPCPAAMSGTSHGIANGAFSS